MDGDFKGDFTRDSFTFDPLRLRQFSRVLMQQGRVQLDADWNEQADLFLYALRTLIKDLVGRHWGVFDFDIEEQDDSPPSTKHHGIIKPDSINPNSFKIKQLQPQTSPPDFSIGKGHYYVDGILCVNDHEDKQPLTYMGQEPKPDSLGNERYWVYLDVWERQITFLEDSDIREVALGESGPDTATRAEVVYQVKTSTVPDIPPDTFDRFGLSGTDVGDGLLKIKFVEDSTQSLEDQLQRKFRGALKARGKAPAVGDVDPCITPPDAQFRGDENQLYRVEIHTGGSATEGPTFKWSRENGSVVFPIVDLDLEGNAVTLGNLGRDSHLSLETGDWVEIVDDDYILRVATLQGPGSPAPLGGSVNPLLQVDKIEVDQVNVLVTLKNTSGGPLPVPVGDLKKHPLLRRWDQGDGTGKKGGGPKLLPDGTIQIKEGTTEDSWITLEDGVQIQFQPVRGTIETHSGGGPEHVYRTGDYWLIPARTIIGDVLWPQENDPSTGMPYLSGHPEALPPHGVKHHYALLAVISFRGNDVDVVPADLRYMVFPLEKLAVILDIMGFTFSQAGL